MASNELDCWKTDPKYIELMNFLIEKSKDAKFSLSVRELAEEFKKKNRSSQEISCLRSRIYQLRSVLLRSAKQLDSIDTAAKVKLLLVLRVPIDTSYLKELQKDADVEVDKENRITKYKAKNGSLNLRQNTPSNNIDDRNARIDNDFLKELLKNAHVENDKHNRITKYEAKSLELEKMRVSLPETPKSVKRAAVAEVSNPSKRAKDSSLSQEKSKKDSDDGSRKSMPKTPGSVKEAAAELSFSSKKAKDSSSTRSKKIENHAPNDSAGVPESGAKEPPNPDIQQLHQTKKQKKLVSEKSQNDSRDKSMDPIPKTPESVKRSAVEVPNSSKKTRIDELKTKDLAPDDALRIRIPELRDALNILTTDQLLQLKATLLRSFPLQPTNPGIQQLLQPEKQIKVGSEKSQKYSDDGSQERIPKTSKSVKRSAAEVPNSSKRTKDSSSAASMKPENRAPNDSAGIPESGAKKPPNPEIQQQKMVTEKSQNDSDDGSMDPIPKTPESVKSVATEMPSSSETAKDSSSTRSRNIEDHAPNDSAGIPESEAREPPNPETQQLRQPKEEDVPEAPNSRNDGAPRTSGGDIAREKPIKTEPGADDGYASRIKFLETIRFLVLNLDMPILSTLQARIEKKLRESSPDAKISNDEMVAALELLVAKIASQSVSNPSENVESVRFSHFLCYLKTAILNSKLEGLKGLLEKINAKIKEPISKDKNIPVEKVATALHSILRATGF